MTEYRKLLALEEAFPDYNEYDLLVCRESNHDELGVANPFSHGVYVWIGADDGSGDAWHTIKKFNDAFRVVGVQHGDRKMVGLRRRGATWVDTDGWNYIARDDGLFEKGITGDAFELAKRISEDFILVS